MNSKNNFWRQSILENNLITILAPMEDVTDSVFRRVVSHCGRSKVFFTEFTNVEGLGSVGRQKLIHRLNYEAIEKPIVAQIWGITPEDYYNAAKLVLELGFDGLDINMGCPVKNVIKQGACSALINNPSLANEIVMATKEALADQIPLSIKTRIGFDDIQTQAWIGFLLETCEPQALTIHGRTVKEESKVPCHFEEIGKVVQINNNFIEIRRHHLQQKPPLEKGDIIRNYLKERLMV